MRLIAFYREICFNRLCQCISNNYHILKIHSLFLFWNLSDLFLLIFVSFQQLLKSPLIQLLLSQLFFTSIWYD